MKVELYLHKLNSPVIYADAESTYQKGDFLCVKLRNNKVHKYPVADIFRIIEDYQEKADITQLLVEDYTPDMSVFAGESYGPDYD